MSVFLRNQFFFCFLSIRLHISSKLLLRTLKTTPFLKCMHFFKLFLRPQNSVQISTKTEKNGPFKHLEDHKLRNGTLKINKQIHFLSPTLYALIFGNIHFCIWNYLKFSFMGSPLQQFWSVRSIHLKKHKGTRNS